MCPQLLENFVKSILLTGIAMWMFWAWHIEISLMFVPSQVASPNRTSDERKLTFDACFPMRKLTSVRVCACVANLESLIMTEILYTYRIGIRYHSELFQYVIRVRIDYDSLNRKLCNGMQLVDTNAARLWTLRSVILIRACKHEQTIQAKQMCIDCIYSTTAYNYVRK